MGYTVYKHTSPSNKVYIGITSKTVKQRWGRNGKGYRFCPYFYRAIQKYGWDNIKHEVLHEGLTEEEACEMEVKLIAEYKATDPQYGYNDLIGATSGKHGRPYSQEQLAKMSEAQKKLWQDPEYRAHMSEVHKGKVLPLEQRQKMSEAHKGRPPVNAGKPLSAETKDKLSRIMKENGNKPPSWKGKHHTEEAKQKIGEAHKGFNPFLVTPMSDEWKAKCAKSIRERCSKPILQFTKDGEFVAEYPSGADAAVALGNRRYQANISSCALKKIKSAYGFVWEYKEQLNGDQIR